MIYRKTRLLRYNFVTRHIHVNLRLFLESAHIFTYMYTHSYEFVQVPAEIKKSRWSPLRLLPQLSIVVDCQKSRLWVYIDTKKCADSKNSTFMERKRLCSEIKCRKVLTCHCKAIFERLQQCRSMVFWHFVNISTY